MRYACIYFRATRFQSLIAFGASSLIALAASNETILIGRQTMKLMPKSALNLDPFISEYFYRSRKFIHQAIYLSRPDTSVCVKFEY